MKARMFSSALYSSAYETIIRLIEKVKKDAYHCAKLENSLRDWAQGGR
jgi:hypothetical protein